MLLFACNCKPCFLDLHYYYSPLSLLNIRTPSPGKPGYYSLLKNQVMKKIKLMVKDENVQARLVVAGFVIIFALLALFFF